MQIKLFAALDGQGNVRFVTEVPRGAACDCFCPMCASPLVAKQGAINDWHFAHEASQERVECAVGAANMIRRIAAEWLRAQGAPALPKYSQQIGVKSMFSVVTRNVEWDAQMQRETLQWDTSGGQSAPFVSGRLSTGVPFDAAVVVEDQTPKLFPPTDQISAHLYFWVPMPVQADLAKRIYLEQHIRNRGKWIWRSHPDHRGAIAQARRDAQVEADAVSSEAHAKLRRLRESFARSQEMAQAAAKQRVEDQNEQRRRLIEEMARPDNSASWAPNRKPKTSFVLYQLKDDQGTWVMYTRFDGTHWLVPLPAFDGWDESLPASIGHARPDQVAYHLTNQPGAAIFLAGRASAVRSSSDPFEIEALVGLR